MCLASFCVGVLVLMGWVMGDGGLSLFWFGLLSFGSVRFVSRPFYHFELCVWS